MSRHYGSVIEPEFDDEMPDEALFDESESVLLFYGDKFLQPEVKDESLRITE